MLLAKLINPQISQFGFILLFIVAGVVFVVAGLFTASLLRPHRPNEEKNSTYECGEDTQGSAWGQFHFRFYLIALIFVLFEVEAVLLMPWAVVFGQSELQQATGGTWGWFAVAEAFVFVGLLGLGLAYVWAKGHLEWIRPNPQPQELPSQVPPQLYAQLNEQWASFVPVKPHHTAASDGE